MPLCRMRQSNGARNRYGKGACLHPYSDKFIVNPAGICTKWTIWILQRSLLSYSCEWDSSCYVALSQPRRWRLYECHLRDRSFPWNCLPKYSVEFQHSGFSKISWNPTHGHNSRPSIDRHYWTQYLGKKAASKYDDRREYPWGTFPSKFISARYSPSSIHRRDLADSDNEWRYA